MRPPLAALQAITCLAWSDSGAVLVTGGEDTLVNAWLLADVLDATAGQQLQVRHGSRAPVAVVTSWQFLHEVRAGGAWPLVPGKAAMLRQPCMR